VPPQKKELPDKLGSFVSVGKIVGDIAWLGEALGVEVGEVTTGSV